MDPSWRRIVSDTHACGRQAVVAITGGGTGAIAELLRVPGGSRLLLEAVVPYDGRALESFLGASPDQACSAETAVAMARRARDRAAALAAPGTPVLGLGATASLVSDRPKQGDHRVHVAVTTDTGTAMCSIVLAKGRRDRPAEEDVVARAVVLHLARACGVSAPSPRELLDADESYAETTLDAIDLLVAGEVDRVTATPDGRVASSVPLPKAVFAGSFNPVHEGHLTLARVAEEILGTPVVFELSVVNADKPPLPAAEVRRRLAQFPGRTVELTRSPTFREKCRLFPGATFVVGADTAERVVAARYYGGDEAGQTAALQDIADRGCRFLVAVRVDGTGRVHTLADAHVPARFASLFTPIPESRFRLDTSSSEVRARAERATSG